MSLMVKGVWLKGSEVHENYSQLRRSKGFYHYHVEQHDLVCPADTSLVFLASETPFPVYIVCLSIYDIFIVEKDSHVPPTPFYQDRDGINKLKYHF